MWRPRTARRGLAVAVVLVLANTQATSAFASAQESFRFRADVELVYVDVFVSLDGAAVSGLTADRFEVLDDGKRRDVRLVDVQAVPQTFALLVDESGSITGKKREILHRALTDFSRRLDANAELTVLGFAERTTLRRPLGFAGTPLGGDLLGDGGGFTALNDALYVTLSYLGGAHGRPILVVFTDGMDNASFVDEEMVLDAARGSEAVVYFVKADAGLGVVRGGAALIPGGPAVRSSAMLESLIELTGGRSVDAGRPEQVADALEVILAEVSARYLLVFEPGQAKPGWHELRVGVEGLSADVRARSGYFASAP